MWRPREDKDAGIPGQGEARKGAPIGTAGDRHLLTSGLRCW